jgi:hypothetical protein
MRLRETQDGSVVANAQRYWPGRSREGHAANSCNQRFFCKRQDKKKYNLYFLPLGSSAGLMQLNFAGDIPWIWIIVITKAMT